MKILVFGDIVSRIGRRAVARILPELKAELEPDLTIANAENLAHGKGVTRETLQELLDAGVDFFTSGNHIWDKPEVFEIFSDPRFSDRIIRPGNYPTKCPGEGAKLLTVGTKNVLVINLLGRVHSKALLDDPFRLFDETLAAYAPKRPSIVLVDFHVEATSEAVAFGWHADGRATAVWGTHKHVATRDERVLPGGTAYITDVGMTGLRDGVIGVDREPILKNFTTQLPVRHEIADEGMAQVNALLIETGADSKAMSVTHVHRETRI